MVGPGGESWRTAAGIGWCPMVKAGIEAEAAAVSVTTAGGRSNRSRNLRRRQSEGGTIRRLRRLRRRERGDVTLHRRLRRRESGDGTRRRQRLEREKEARAVSIRDATLTRGRGQTLQSEEELDRGAVMTAALQANERRRKNLKVNGAVSLASGRRLQETRFRMIKGGPVRAPAPVRPGENDR